MARIIVGLPSLSRGPLLNAARELGAPVMISATALAKWQDQGPVPPGYEFNAMEMRSRHARGDTSPPSAAQRRRRMRQWQGWNTAALDRVRGTGVEIHVDSAGFVAMALFGGFPWTVESYVNGLASHPSITRFSSMDLCVEPEVAPDVHEAEERLSKTIRLNRQIDAMARDAGIRHKMMPVIQGANAEQYMRCFDAISAMISPGETIGVGSMCRRPTRGPEGSTAIIDHLDRNLPKGVRLHLFGIKSDGAEAACAFGDRIDSVDSQSYGVRARRIANDERSRDPGFSKTQVMVAGVMRAWYAGQQARLESPRSFPLQAGLDLGGDAWKPATVLDALERVARSGFNTLIEDGELDHDQIIAGRMLDEEVMGLVGDLPEGVNAMDPWQGRWQLPGHVIEEGALPPGL